MRRIFLLCLAILLIPNVAWARHHHRHYKRHAVVEVQQQFAMFPGIFFQQPLQTNQAKRERHRRYVAQDVNQASITRLHSEYSSVQMLSHPSGCPARAFCGCGAAAELGLRDRALWLARNWLRFPHVSHEMAQPNMAAARVGHVMVLKERIHGNVWMVADYNSGGHLSRLHPRDITAYTVVSPRG